MAQIAKISQQVQLKSCGQKFYEFLKTNNDCLPGMFPKNLKSCSFVKGNSSTPGSVSVWKYDFDFGKTIEMKVKQLVDEPNKTLIYECLDGDLFNDYEMFKVKIKVNDGGNNGNCSVNFSVEFVKANENVAPPTSYLKFAVKLFNGLDAHLCKN